jgi:ribosomal protein S18 acetylase RimI-like enzyme
MPLAPPRGPCLRPSYLGIVTESEIAIRHAENSPTDVAVVDTFIRELAKEEGLPSATATVDDLTSALFGQGRVAHALIAEVLGTAAGFAIYYPKYSTVTGRRGLHLEDVYVAPPYRDRHVGRALLDHLQELAGPRGMVDWWVMRANDGAIGFYRRIGARELDGIAVFRRDHPSLSPSSVRTGLASSEGANS